VPGALVDINSRAGYSIIGSKPQTHIEKAAEYYQFDWEYAQTPEQTSWVASSWVCTSLALYGCLRMSGASALVLTFMTRYFHSIGKQLHV